MSKVKFSKILKTLNLKSIIILIILLAFNSYAWFIYATKVSGTLDVHVSSWNVGFKAGEQELGTNITFDVATIYPGMDTYTKTLTVNNTGEVAAKLSYKVTSVRVLGTTYTANETTTSDSLINMLETSYPFSISMSTSSQTISAGSGQAIFSISIDWPLDGGQDALDTSWGEQAYEYYQVNSENSAIHVELEISASQTL